MIGTFWNLCRACPSMPVDKLHSEYRSTYRWHEYTGPRQEVVRKPPQPISGNKEEEENKNVENIIAPPTSGGNIEPALPRRKKNPSLAYRTHDLLTSKRDKENHTSTSLDRARISNFPLESCDGGGLKSAISRISTEYRLQFAWPRGKRGKEEESSGPPRKSLSMGAIRPVPGSNPTQGSQPPAPVHKKRILQADKLGGTAELEPLVSNQESEYTGEEKIIQESFSKGEKLQSDNVEFKTEYKKKFRPFSQYDYIEGRFKPKRESEPQILHELENEHQDSWFSEVIELRKKAGEYKHRGWGTELVPEHIAELYNKQITLWEQVSRRSSLSALSLASTTHRSITKEEKEKENNKKSSPTNAFWPENVIKHSQKSEKSDEIRKDFPPRSRIDHFVRHHLERTTGVGEEGILHSPTREKLEPVLIRRKDFGNESTRSPQKVQPHIGRSQSAGPNTSSVESRSPKRTQRVSHGTKQLAADKKQRPKLLDR